jgi:uncharacterized membrane protein
MPARLGPIEVVTISFPGSKFDGKILDEVEKLTERDIVNVVDGVLVRKTASGDVEFTEFTQDNLEGDAAPLADLLGEVVLDLLSEEDVRELGAGLEPGSSAAMIVFEHEWIKPLRNAIGDTGGILVSDLHVPGPVVDEVLEALDEPVAAGTDRGV